VIAGRQRDGAQLHRQHVDAERARRRLVLAHRDSCAPKRERSSARVATSASDHERERDPEEGRREAN
jgi:hypothetical protein